MDGIAEHRSGALRAVLVAALCSAACVMVASAVFTPSAATATASPSPSPSAPPTSETLTTTVVHAVTAHSGSRTSVVYRADDTAGGTVTVDLLVTTRSGEVVRRLVTGRGTVVGVANTWHGRVRLRAGRYLLVAHAVDASGLPEASAQTAALRVLAPLPPLVPTARARRAAFAWAARRAGSVAVAVVDSRGHRYGYHAWRPFITASVVKAMLLVAYLRHHRSVSSGMRATLARMITVSDNNAADAIFRRVGRTGLARLARLAHLRSFRASSAWITSRVAPADMARFFRDMEGYLPRRHRRFANGLLARIVSWQRWGIPAGVGSRGYRVYDKPGWLGAWTLAQRRRAPRATQGAHRPRRVHKRQSDVVLRQGDHRRRDRAAAEALTRDSASVVDGNP